MFSQPLHGFPDITAIITEDRYCLMLNHGLSVGGFKIDEAAVMLANLLFSLWLSVNTTTVQHCLPAYSFSCVLVSTALSSLGGSQAATTWFQEAQRSSSEGQRGWSLLRVLTPNPKPLQPCFLFLRMAARCVSTREHWEWFLLPLSFARSILQFPHRTRSRLSACQTSSGFWPLFSSCAEVSLHSLLLMELDSPNIALSLNRALPSYSLTTCRISFSFYQSHILSVFVTPGPRKLKELRGISYSSCFLNKFW